MMTAQDEPILKRQLKALHASGIVGNRKNESRRSRPKTGPMRDARL
jgi:hypothetical protein